jgi:hypothetical protein
MGWGCEGGEGDYITDDMIDGVKKMQSISKFEVSQSIYTFPCLSRRDLNST